MNKSGFIHQMLSANNAASYGRFASLNALYFVIAAEAYIMYVTKCVTGLTEIPPSWQAIILGPFAISKAFDVVQSMFGKEKGADNDPPSTSPSGIQ